MNTNTFSLPEPETLHKGEHEYLVYHGAVVVDVKPADAPPPPRSPLIAIAATPDFDDYRFAIAARCLGCNDEITLDNASQQRGYCKRCATPAPTPTGFVCHHPCGRGC